MKKAAPYCVSAGALGLLWFHGLIALAQGPAEPSNPPSPNLKSDPRLKAVISTNFKKPKVSDLLDSLQEATRLEFSTNGKIELSEEAFGSVSFRKTPAWIVMRELAKSDAVKGHWEKTDKGYKLVGSLDEAARETRVAALKKNAPLAVQTPEPPLESSGQIWILIATMSISGAIYLLVVVRRWRTRSQDLEQGN